MYKLGLSSQLCQFDCDRSVYSLYNYSGSQVYQFIQDLHKLVKIKFDISVKKGIKLPSY